VVAVEDHQERVVDRGLAAGVRLGDRVAVVEDHQGAGVAVRPVLVAHVFTGRGEPGDVAEVALTPVVGSAGEEASAAKDRVLAPQPGQSLREGDQRLLVGVQVPVDPGRLVVLAVDVVVAVLRTAQLVAVGNHRDALREHQGGEDVALLALAQLEHLGVVGLALDTAVP